MYDYACDKEEVLCGFLELPCGIPSHDTLNRVFRRLDPTQLETVLTNWGKQIVGLLSQQQLIVDGKQLRGTVETGHKQATVQIVSVWAEKERLCLAQSQIGDKTNEIKAIPELLKTLDITGSVVSIDAIGCQKTITELIVDRKAYYLIDLKANQDGLYEQVAAWFERTKPCLQADISRDLGHGRAEKRIILVSDKLDLVDAAEGWASLKSLIYVESIRWINHKEQRSKRYYISSLAGHSAAQAGHYIRRHWRIENEQHWHLDITFGEDACQVRKDHAPHNLSTVRKLVFLKD